MFFNSDVPKLFTCGSDKTGYIIILGNHAGECWVKNGPANYKSQHPQKEA